MVFSLVAWVATGDVNVGARIVLSAVPAQAVSCTIVYVPGPTPSDHVEADGNANRQKRAGRSSPGKTYGTSSGTNRSDCGHGWQLPLDYACCQEPGEKTWEAVLRAAVLSSMAEE